MLSRSCGPCRVPSWSVLLAKNREGCPIISAALHWGRWTQVHPSAMARDHTLAGNALICVLIQVLLGEAECVHRERADSMPANRYLRRAQGIEAEVTKSTFRRGHVNAASRRNGDGWKE